MNYQNSNFNLNPINFRNKLRWIKKARLRYCLRKRSAGAAPEVNLRNPRHSGNKTYKRGIHPGFEIPGQTAPEVHNMGILSPTKKDPCPPKN